MVLSFLPPCGWRPQLEIVGRERLKYTDVNKRATLTKLTGSVAVFRSNWAEGLRDELSEAMPVSRTSAGHRRQTEGRPNPHGFPTGKLITSPPMTSPTLKSFFGLLG